MALIEEDAVYLITGVSGTVGRPLIDSLVGAGARVRALTRDAKSAAEWPSGVEVVEGDPSLPETVAPFLTGVTGVFLHSRAAAAAPAGLLALAKEHGVRRVVALSATNVDEPAEHQPSRFQGDRNKEVEQAAMDSGLDWVSVRASFFAANTRLTWAGQISAGDDVFGPFPDFAEAPLHERDLAEVVARALLTDGFTGRKLEVTGARSLTHAEMVEVIGTVLGRTLRYREIPADSAAAAMIARGFPEAFVEALMNRYRRLSGQPGLVTDGVAEVLGRPPRSYADWVADNAAAFRV
ncbi:NAD(P)H-binding protein [Amycolatopsis alba]|uniref:Nucleoside-diphosphate sugar epimerase n=1 Tax=Amycolatopsis alba DSM 44262 TaxID=1125972 RepID=A0A229RZ76_AMYAL|nr:NAD(P)H-binding protein [Amycolatopsis alba]OXM51654.1 nucleoside-diphosphate sugar epimerase [Amycolatopsis alba DSM 44262]